MNGGGHGVGTPLASRPSLSPGGVARAPRRPSSVHALPSLGAFSTALPSLGAFSSPPPRLALPSDGPSSFIASPPGCTSPFIALPTLVPCTGHVS